MNPRIGRPAPPDRPAPPAPGGVTPYPAETSPYYYPYRSPEPSTAMIPSSLVFLAGVWLVIAPFALDYRDTEAGLAGYWNDIVVGVALVVVSLVRISAPTATAPLSFISVALGGWLVAAPYALSYDYGDADSAATWNDVVVGAVVVLLALTSWAAARHAQRSAAHGRDQR